MSLVTIQPRRSFPRRGGGTDASPQTRFLGVSVKSSRGVSTAANLRARETRVDKSGGKAGGKGKRVGEQFFRVNRTPA